MFGLIPRNRVDASSSEADEASDTRKVVLLGAVAAILVLALGYFLILPLFSGSSSRSQAGPVVPHKVLPSGTTTPTSAVPTQSPVATVPALSAADAGRDPFAPLPAEAAAAAAAAATTAASSASSAPATTTATPGSGPTSTSTGTTSSTATATASPSPSATTGTTPSGATGASTRTASSAAVTDNTPSTGSAVQVMAVRGSTADIQIDNKPFTVTAGSSATAGYSVVSVGNGSVVIRHAGVNHTLMEGELQTF